MAGGEEGGGGLEEPNGSDLLPLTAPPLTRIFNMCIFYPQPPSFFLPIKLTKGDVLLCGTSRFNTLHVLCVEMWCVELFYVAITQC